MLRLNKARPLLNRGLRTQDGRSMVPAADTARSGGREPGGPTSPMPFPEHMRR